MEELHNTLKERIETHIDIKGHTVKPFKEENVTYDKKYTEVIGEVGATYYLRRRFQPESTPNWGVHNPEFMEAFYNPGSICDRRTVITVRCGAEKLFQGQENPNNHIYNIHDHANDTGTHEDAIDPPENQDNAVEEELADTKDSSQEDTPKA